MNTSRRLFTGSVLRIVQFALQLAVVFLLTPFTIHVLGPWQYGSWVLITTCVGYTAYMDMGLSTAVARHISRAAGQGNEEEMNRVAGTAFRLFSTIGLIVFMATLVGAGVCWWALADRGRAEALALVVLFLGTRMALKFPARAFDGVLTSHLRYDLQVVASLAGFFLSYGLIYRFLCEGRGMVAMAVALFAGGVVEYSLTILFALRACPALRLWRTRSDPATRKTLYNYSWKTMMWHLANMLRFKVDAPVIAHFLGPVAITPYNPGAQLNNYFFEFVTTVIGNLSPVFSRLEGKGDYEAIRDRFLMMTRIASVLSLYIGGSIIFYSHDFILRWLGVKFVGQHPGQLSEVVAIILAIGYTLTLMQTPTSSLLYGISKHQYGATMCLVEGVLNLGLSLALVKPYGIYGIALGTTIASVINQVFVYPVVASHCVQLPVRVFYREVGGVALKVCALLALYFWVMHSWLRPDYLTLAALNVAQVLLVGPACYFFVLGKPEKERLNQLALAALQKLRGGRAK